MNVTLRYFASIREAIGLGSESFITQGFERGRLRAEAFAAEPNGL